MSEVQSATAVAAENRRNAWEDSYRRGENHVFFPCDEVIRFVARYLRRRVDQDTVRDVNTSASGEPLRMLDLGCGMGRNLVFGESMGVAMFGIELSQVAVDKARAWLKKSGVKNPEERVFQGDVRELPFPNGFFDHALSDSALDSMPFTVAQEAVRKTALALKPNGLFYLNLIAKVAVTSGVAQGPAVDEEVVSTNHEKDTIQSYFDREKIHTLLDPSFTIINCEMHRIEDEFGGTIRGRWHITCRKK